MGPDPLAETTGAPQLLLVRGVEIAHWSEGEGPAVVCLHETAAAAAVWRPLAAALSARARVVAYDRRGWGASGVPQGYRATSVEEQAEDAAALMAELGIERAVLCGAGLGAVAALDLARRRPEIVAGALLIEPPLFAFLPQATEGLSADRAAVEEAVRDGGVGAAVDLYLGGGLPFLGPGAARIPRQLAAAAAERPRSLFAEIAAVPSWTIGTAGALRAAAPSRVVAASEAPALLQEAAAVLASRLGGKEVLLVEGEGPPHVGAPGRLAAAVEALLSPS